ncbi:phosphotransferase [Aliiglaciecola sp. CAU 1673]|uniref:phosphotransferase n=1 Tax=Aliiglaciecola sp. CAU 1673 TaxID=3032595 RepID=UPI0023D9D594|nr:phosphotransferase [Aliiglaciecola sp. CAU 1673]MDF2180078.1 phosphotransferase [Aliiglaciecola sp. CAU 1673]
MLPESVHRELAALPWLDTDFELIPVRAGAINQNFRLNSQGQSYFLKCFAEKGPSKLDRAALFQLQTRLADNGFAPRPLYLGKDNQFSLEQWINVEDLSQSQLSSRARIHVLATRLAHIHNLPIQCAPLELIADWKGYLRQLGRADSQTLSEVQKLSEIWQQRPKLTFCHHDLSMGHVCLSSEKMTLDWEYAAQSDPVFDLASCALVNGLSRVESEHLCRDYAVQRDLAAETVMADFELMMPLAELTSRLWYQVAQQQWRA